MNKMANSGLDLVANTGVYSNGCANFIHPFRIPHYNGLGAPTFRHRGRKSQLQVLKFSRLQFRSASTPGTLPLLNFRFEPQSKSRRHIIICTAHSLAG